MGSTFTSHKNGKQKLGSKHTYPNTTITKIIRTGFFMVDQQWTVTSWNPMAEKILGISARDIVGKNFWNELRDVIPMDFYAVYHQALLQDIPAHFTIYWKKRRAWFDVTTCHFGDSLSVSFKSSHHTQSPESSARQLKTLNDMYRLITEVTTDCLWEWDLLSQQILWIDGGHQRAFGYQLENALIPQSFWEARLHPDDKVRVMASLQAFVAQEISDDWEEEYRFEKADGEYVYVHDRGHRIRNGEKRTSRMIGATQDITARKSAELQLLTTERNLAWQLLKNKKEIIAAVLMAQEKERANIGKELHDNLNQILGASKLFIEMAKTDEENRGTFLQKSADYIVTVIEEIHNISKNLAGPRLNIMGLSESIRILVDDLIRIHPICIHFQQEDINPEELTENLQLDIFRVVQEQLNNIVKHAKASQAEIHLTKKGNTIVLLISDNGVGCNITTNNKGVGNLNILSRADIYQGNVLIQSHPGEGYVLKVEFIDVARDNW